MIHVNLRMFNREIRLGEAGDMRRAHQLASLVLSNKCSHASSHLVILSSSHLESFFFPVVNKTNKSASLQVLCTFIVLKNMAKYLIKL